MPPSSMFPGLVSLMFPFVLSACAEDPTTTRQNADVGAETGRPLPDAGPQLDGGALDASAVDTNIGNMNDGETTDASDGGLDVAADVETTDGSGDAEDVTADADVSDATDDATEIGVGEDSGSDDVAMADSGAGDVDPDAGACAWLTESAREATMPVDIVWVIDGSPSMDDSIAVIEANLNTFATRIAEAGLNYRVVLIGADRDYCFDARCYNEICVPPPLSGASGCPDTDSPTYLHVRTGVHSSDAIDLAMAQYTEYSDFLRRRANTHFVFVTDDDAGFGPGADEFERFLADASAPGFSRVRVHSIVDLVDSPDGCGVWDECSCGAERGDEYIALSDRTDGLVQSVCEADWTPILEALEERVVEDTALPCAYAVPDVGTTVEVDRVNVVRVADDGTRSTVPNVDSAADCGSGAAWHWDTAEDPTAVVLCSAACGVTTGSVELEFGCSTVKR